MVFYYKEAGRAWRKGVALDTVLKRYRLQSTAQLTSEIYGKVMKSLKNSKDRSDRLGLGGASFALAGILSFTDKVISDETREYIKLKNAIGNSIFHGELCMAILKERARLDQASKR